MLRNLTIVPLKVCQMGIKKFVRARKSDIIYDFFFYTVTFADTQSWYGDYVVRKLCETLPKNKNFRLHFDYWFLSINLCLELKKLGILTTAALYSSGMLENPLMIDNVLKKIGRGSSLCKNDSKSDLTIFRWFKSIQLTSNYVSPEVTCKVRT